MEESSPTYSVVDGAVSKGVREVLYGDKPIGPATAIISDPGQDLAKLGLSYSHRLPTGERSFTDHLLVGAGVILVEEKRLQDLANSFLSHRLQRQLRRMLMVNPDGANVLAFRGGRKGTLWENLYANELRLGAAGVELLKWQLLGGYIGFLPQEPQAAFEELVTWRAVVRPGRHLLSILAGDDRKVDDGGLTPVAKALMRMLPGVGRKIAARWAAYADEDVVAALKLPPGAFKEVGVHAGIQKKIAEVVSGRY